MYETEKEIYPRLASLVFPVICGLMHKVGTKDKKVHISTVACIIQR